MRGINVLIMGLIVRRFGQAYRNIRYGGNPSIVLVRKDHVEYVETFFQHVVDRFLVIRRVVVDTVLSELGEESFFMGQIGNAFRIHPPRVRRGARVF